MSTQYSKPEEAHMTQIPLRERRKALGLSQQQVAYLAGCSISRVGQIERELASDASPVRDRIAAIYTEREQARAAEQPA